MTTIKIRNNLGTTIKTDKYGNMEITGNYTYQIASGQVHEAVNNDDVDKFSDELKNKHGLEKLHLSYNDKNKHLKVNHIVVSKEHRGTGRGSSAMRDITSFADKHSLKTSLTPDSKESGHGTTSTTRLKKFYKGHDFVENKGKNKDYSLSDGMYREPKTVKEDAPTNSMSAQAIAGGRDGEQPPIKNKSSKVVIASMLRRKMKE